MAGQVAIGGRDNLVLLDRRRLHGGDGLCPLSCRDSSSGQNGAALHIGAVAMTVADSAKTADAVEIVEQAIEVSGVRWALIFADMLRPALLDDAGVINGEAQTIVAGCIRCVPPGKVARLRLVIADFHILALVLPDLRTCRLYTPGLAQESFLLHLSADARLQEHVDAATQY